MYTLTRRDISDYSRRHQDGMLFFMWASADYTAARCCMLYHLGTGYRLASEAIEKLIKAAIYFETGVKPQGSNSLMHNPYLLKEKLKAVRDYNLDRYDAQLKKLADHYYNRYHDNQVSGQGSSSEELLQIDEIWLALIELMPIPKEVLYRSYFFSSFLDDWVRPLKSDYELLTTNNRALAPKLDLFKKEYDEVLEYYLSLSNE